VRWPDEETTRLDLAARGLPRILLVGATAAPPEHWDDLEDWVRLPLDPDELRSRARTLARRARARARPWFDADGMLRVDERWIAFPDAPRAVVAVLVERFGELVRTEEISEAYLEHGGSIEASARKAMIVRVRHRLAGVGLALQSVRDRGYLLHWADDGDATEPSDARAAS
jgi:DNA-binding response OmpR family regulator